MAGKEKLVLNKLTFGKIGPNGVNVSQNAFIIVLELARDFARLVM
jgi:hypothetical protein